MKSVAVLAMATLLLVSLFQCCPWAAPQSSGPVAPTESYVESVRATLTAEASVPVIATVAPTPTATPALPAVPTDTASPTVTPAPTDTPEPTSTPVPTSPPPPSATPQPELSMEERQTALTQAIIGEVEQLYDVDRVSLVRFGTGFLEMEVFTAWASESRQPPVSWTIVNMLADALAATTPNQRLNLTGSEDLLLRLTTYSTNAEYRYKSETDYSTMVKLNNRSISYEEWLQLANAGFR